MLNFGLKKYTGNAAIETDFTVVSDFTSVQDGLYNDGATWGNESPGVWGKDYPGPEDTALVKHRVTVPKGKSYSTKMQIGTNGNFIVQGNFTMEDDLIVTKGITLFIDGGNLNLNEHNIDTSGYYEGFILKSRGGTITGKGMIGKQAAYKYSIAQFDFENTIVNGITGFYSCANRSGALGDSPHRIINTRFMDCSGRFDLQYMDNRCGTGTSILRHVYIEGFENVFLGGKKQDNTNTLDYVVFNHVKQLQITNNWIGNNVVIVNSTYLPQSNSTNIKLTNVLFIEAPLDGYAGGQTSIYSHGGTIKNCYFYTTYENPHLMYINQPYLDATEGVDIDGIIIEATAEHGDGGDMILFGVTDTPTPFSLTNSILIDKTGGALLNAIGKDITAEVTAHNNTIFVDKANSTGYYGHLARNETNGRFVGKTELLRNLVYNNNPDTPKTAAIYLLRDDPDQITTTDENCFHNITDKYVQVTITGKSIGDEGFGRYDIEADPEFTDKTRNLIKYGASISNDTSEHDIIHGFMNIADADYSGNYSIQGLIEYVREGFTPNNAELYTDTSYRGAVKPAVDKPAPPVFISSTSINGDDNIPCNGELIT